MIGTKKRALYLKVKLQMDDVPDLDARLLRKVNLVILQKLRKDNRGSYRRTKAVREKCRAAKLGRTR